MDRDMGTESRERINFASAGETCVGDLFHPSGADAGERLPAIVLGNGYGGLRDAVRPQAAHFARAGYRALAIDYRYFGESEGAPRGRLFPLDQVEDFRNAVSYLQSRDDVDPDAIAIWGTSFAGGIVLYTAAVDERVKAVISQVPVVDGYHWLRGMRSPVQWAELLDGLAEDRRQRYLGKSSRTIPKCLASRSGLLCGLAADDELAAFAAAGAKARIAAGEETAAEISLESIEKIMEFSPERVIDRIAPRHLLIATNTGPDMVHPYVDVVRAYRTANEPKSFLPLAMSQLEVYVSPGLDIATRRQIEWLNERLPTKISGAQRQ